jgi:cytochrome d ubiquinol oxidase subunit II
VVIVSALGGLGSLALRARRSHPVCRSARLLLSPHCCGPGRSQYPLVLLPGLTIDQAAARPEVLHVTLAVITVGAVLLIPSLWWLFTLFQRPAEAER